MKDDNANMDIFHGQSISFRRSEANDAPAHIAIPYFRKYLPCSTDCINDCAHATCFIATDENPSSMSQQLKDSTMISNRASAEEVARRTLEFMSSLAGPSQ